MTDLDWRPLLTDPIYVSGSRTGGSRLALVQAILQTVAYADVFDYPLTLAEIYHYLVGVSASLEAVQDALQANTLLSTYLVQEGGYYVLPGREHLIPLRQGRSQQAHRLWPRALTYARWISRLPFVRMVAVTGTLSVDNVEQQADLDYLVVTAPGRLWLCRGMAMLLVRFAGLRGDVVCPNYFISERALVFTERNLYTAHELVQMVPLSGPEVFRRMWSLNNWAFDFLPNAAASPPDRPASASPNPFYKNWLESWLSAAPGAYLEKFEMQRKLRQLTRPRAIAPEAAFSADWCKGHFNNHGQHTLSAYASRLHQIEEDLSISLGISV